jgi:uncharacterized SAM-binding protein YcdF (DUF218 family)
MSLSGKAGQLPMADRFSDNLRYAIAGDRLSRLGRMTAFFVSSCLILAAVYVAGFLAFVYTLNPDEPDPVQPADAIVVLTGGADRIADAMQLLAEGKGKRLLISGVHSATTPQSVARRLPEYSDLFSCCVDFDYGAANTVGNAIEARRWARDHQIRSMMIVTSNYHMPRTLIEFRRAMPQAQFLARPVVPYGFDVARWYRDPGVGRVLLGEYSKYIAASARALFSPIIEEDPSSRGVVKRGLAPG